MIQAANGFYEVAVGERAVYVRVHGLASMNNCLCVRDFIEDMLRSDHSFVVVDLADCTGMDSTFMGALASAATFEREEPRPGVAVVNAGEPLTRLLDGVGLSELILVEEDPFEAPGIEFLRLDEKADEEERLACIRETHRKLMEISDKNEKAFGVFVTALEAEMKQRGLL